MQPQQPGNTISNASPENQVSSQPTPEQASDLPVTPEAPAELAERPSAAEQLVVDRAGQSMQPTVVTQITQDQPQQKDDTAQQDIVTTKSTPQTADDSDKIEKEWVDKIKQVISSTSSDPHAQQSEVSRLMADYVLKRFGKKVGTPEE